MGLAFAAAKCGLFTVLGLLLFGFGVGFEILLGLILLFGVGISVIGLRLII